MDISIKKAFGMHFKIKLLLLIIFIVSIILYTSDKNIKKDEKMDIKTSWEKLHTYWISKNIEMYHNGTLKIYSEDTRCKGASPSQLKQLQDYYKNIPSSLVESLSICNERNRWFGIEDFADLLDIKGILKTSKDFEKHAMVDIEIEGIYRHVHGDVVNPIVDVPREWIPIYDWNGDYIVAIDMLSNNKGQIIVFCLEGQTLAKWTDSYEEWFELAVDEVIKYGELRVETIEKVLQFPETTINHNIPPTIEINDKHKELDKAIKDMLKNGGWDEEFMHTMSKHYPSHVIDKMKELFPKK